MDRVPSSCITPTGPTVLVIPQKAGPMGHPGGVPPGVAWEWLDRSVLAANARAVPARGNLVVWSGSYAELDGGGVFEEDPRTWGPKGWGALERAVESMGEARERLVIRTHARHVVSDVPGCRKLLGAEWGRGVRLLLDPMAMCTPDMLAASRGEDHLTRIFEAIGLFEGGLAGVVVRGDPLVEMLVAKHVPASVARCVISPS